MMREPLPVYKQHPQGKMLRKLLGTVFTNQTIDQMVPGTIPSVFVRIMVTLFFVRHIYR